MDEMDLRIDVWRTGPHVRVRVTHLPSGRSAEVTADGVGESRLRKVAMSALETVLALDAKLAAH